MLCRYCCRIPSAVALVKIFKIAVENHDGIIYHHSEHDNQSGKGYGVERNAAHIHYSHRDERAERHGDAGNDGCAPRKQQEHHDDDDNHRLDKVHHEVAYAVSYHLALVGYADDRHIFRQFVGCEIVEHLLHVLSVFNDVVALNHLERQQNALVAIVVYSAAACVVFALYGGYVLHAHNLAVRSAEDNLVLNLLFACKIRLDVYRHVLFESADAAAHSGQSGRLHSLHYSHLSYSVRSQTLLVYVDGYLLLIVAVQNRVAYRRHLSETVGKVVAVLLQLLIAAAVALYGYEQCR